MIVLDTSFVLAWQNERDAHHAAARGLADQLRAEVWGRALLPEYVIMEVATVHAVRRSLAAAVATCDLLLRAREIDFVPSSALFEETLTVFRSQGSAGLSFADASIVATARALGARHVATFDSGFEAVEGLQVLPAR